jgi:hypothetical protein
VLRANTAALQQAMGSCLWSQHEGAQGILFRSVTTLGETGQFAAARDTCTNLYRAALGHLGPDHPDTLAARHNLAYWRAQAEDPAGAATAFEGLLTDRLRVLGPDHPDTLATRQSLVYWRELAGL